MEVSNINKVFNEKLFTSEYTMNVSISVEDIQDGAVLGSDKLALIIGKEVLQRISECNVSPKV